jgi:hypothetical protein
MGKEVICAIFHNQVILTQVHPFGKAKTPKKHFLTKTLRRCGQSSALFFNDGLLTLDPFRHDAFAWTGWLKVQTLDSERI